MLYALACIAAALLLLGAYSNSIDNAFQFDDSHVIEENVFIRDLANIPRFFTDARTFSSVPTNATYRPIVSTTLAIDYRLARGLVPRPFHVTQLLLLLATGAMLVALFVKLLGSLGPSPWHRWTALFAGTFFCIHTGNTQPVNYISARSELLAAIGVLGALLLYACSPRARRFQLHVLPMAFGALAKTPAVIAAPLLLAYRLFVEEQLSIGEVFSRRCWPRTRRALISVAPAFVAAIALYAFVEGMNPPGQTYGGGGRLRYLITETWVWVHYVQLFWLPVGLSADTDLGLFETAWDARVAAGAAFAVATLALMWVASRRRETRLVAFGIAWFWIALVPSSTVVPLAEVANDHRVFFPFAGLTLAVVPWLARRLEPTAASTRGSRAGAIVAVALAVSLLTAHAVGTYRRNRVWHSEETLWADVVKQSPRNGRGKMNYGLTQMELGRYAHAKELFVEAEKLVPNYATLEVNLAIVENALGHAAAADSHFTRALALSPSHPAPHRYYARWLIREGRGGEAIPQLVRTLELAPADIEARHLLMSVYAARAAPELGTLAVETLRFASTDSLAVAYARGMSPFRPDTLTTPSWYRLGLGFMRQDRHAEAAQAYRAAAALDSTDADVRNNLGWSLAKLGFYEDAVAEFRSALRHRAGFDLARNNLAWAAGEIANARFRQAFALQQTGHAAEAIEIYRELLATHPRWVNAHFNFGDALMATGRPSEAAAEFRRTLELQPAMTAARVNLAACLRELARSAPTAQEPERGGAAGNKAGSVGVVVP